MFRNFVKFALLAALLALSAPAAFAKNKLMAPAQNQNPQPEEGKALVVFLRPSGLGAAIASTVYLAPDDGTTFLGVVKYKDKLAVQMAPGAHRFMVVAENADFLDANLEAGKTYYVLVSPRVGVMKARFSLLPIHNRPDVKYSLHSADFKEWLTRCSFIQMAPAAEAWYASHREDVEEKKTDYLVKWNAMLPEDRALLVLHAEDGVTSLP